MRFENIETISCDVLVIGGGGASLRAAIQAREMGAEVIIASKSRVGYGNNTYIAAGNMAASGLGDEKDNHEAHLKDTVKGGRFLNDRNLVDLMARNARAQVAFLECCGVDFVKKGGTEIRSRSSISKTCRGNSAPGFGHDSSVKEVR